MKGFTEPFFIGSLKLVNNVLYAPLAGYTDLPFRRICFPYSPGLLFCEMVKMEAVVLKEPNTLRVLEYDPSMHPIGAQLFGSNPSKATQAAKIIENLGFDLLDFNCGCPVEKIVKDGSGSSLLRNLPLLEEILSLLVQAVKIPVTVKTRLGWDEKNPVALEIVKIAEKVGAKAITIHGRTRSQGYGKKANWEEIRICKEQATKILVFGNGDVSDVASAENLFTQTQCDGIVIGRGILGSPWIVEDIRNQALLKPPIVRTPKDLLTQLLLLYDELFRYSYQRNVLFDMRRVSCWYLKGYPGAKALRIAINSASSTKEVYDLVLQAIPKLTENLAF